MQRNVRNGQKVFRFGKKQNSAQLFARLPKVRNYDLAECFLVMKVTRRSIPPYVCLVIMIIRCYAPSLRGVAFLGAATPPTHSPAAAAYIRVLRDDRTDRIESRMIDLNPVTKTKTKHACVPPTHHSPVTGSRSGGPWPSWSGPPSLPRIASDRSRRVSHHLSGKTERRLGQRTDV